MTEPSDDKLSALYRRAEQPEPSALLDRRIRDAAHRAVAGRSALNRLPSLALAATMVMGVGIAWILIDIPPGEVSAPEPFGDVVREERATVAAPPAVPLGPPAVPKTSIVTPERRMEYQLKQRKDRAAESRETESLQDAMPTLMKRQGRCDGAGRPAGGTGLHRRLVAAGGDSRAMEGRYRAGAGRRRACPGGLPGTALPGVVRDVAAGIGQPLLRRRAPGR